MLPYWLLFSTFALGALGYDWRNRQRSVSPMLLFLAILGVALFVGLRWEVSTASKSIHSTRRKIH